MSRLDNQPPAGYRPCVGVVLFNEHGLVFAGRRVDTPGDAWQLPQGGIDAGETPHAAGLRELAEEIGTDSARIIDELPNWLTYDLPEDLAARIWGGQYRGQAQKWLLARFMGSDADFNLGSGKLAEFDAWSWMDLDDIAGQIVSFKRAVYYRLVKAFAARIDRETT